MDLNRNAINSHIKTHSKRSVEDDAAVTTLKSFLSSDGKINTNFSYNDKWPNIDGSFEFVSNPELSRMPEQNFIVQIKGTTCYTEKDDIISYSLQSLAFPAYIAGEVTLDPGILFVVLNPEIRGQKRVFWKYMSPKVIHSIDFEKDSTTIKFCLEEEIKDTDESVSRFCEKLKEIEKTHLFLNKLRNEILTKEDAIKIIKRRCEDISSEINRFKIEGKSRDYISNRIVNGLYDLCYAALILNAVKLGYENVYERLAWEIAQFNVETKYLCNFLKGIKYVGSRIPDDGQAERLMLKYYSYLWEIRRFLKNSYDIKVLDNLEEFPLNTDKLDEEYYKMVAHSISSIDLTPKNPTVTRYYIQRKTPFFVNGERYFEITLQLAGRFATKFNRITVYTKENISTRYSIQIAYENAEITLWRVKNKVKVVTNWKVSVDPRCLNLLSKILYKSTKISSKYGEYNSLMNFLTKTGMNFLDIIRLSDANYNKVLNDIFGKTNTSEIKEIFDELKLKYSKSSSQSGQYTIRYILLNLREETIEEVLPDFHNVRTLKNGPYISSKCYPFEIKPFISNIAGGKSSKGRLTDILEIVDDPQKYNIVRPYLEIERQIKETGELYFNMDSVANLEKVDKYNANLDEWEKGQGFSIKSNNKLLFIEFYEKTTLSILTKLISLSKCENKGQKTVNAEYIKRCNNDFDDKIKESALKNAFVNTNVMLIYGAAGTGKTTLMNHISNMMCDSKKLFLSKTRTALENLERNIKNPGADGIFKTIDSYVKSSTILDYDIVFIDECSTIDNRMMDMFLKKVNKETLLVLSGDVYQIESIDYGNWFYYAKDIIKSKDSNVELFSTWRTDKEELKSLWSEVRTVEPIITEKLSMDGPFSSDIGEDIFVHEDGEIVLCLNYDGKFGLNSMNLYFQNANTSSKPYSWNGWIFKVGDPIIFVNPNRSSLLYNNLTGRIVSISINDSAISFTLDVDTVLNEQQCRNESFEVLQRMEAKTRILLDVIAYNDELKDEDRIKTIIPFQIAYAVSIHKAQGLEFNSVKIVIPSNNAEKITHDIFYTAITRAREKLRIYWSAETMQSIVEGFTKEKKEQKSLTLIKKKLGIDTD